MSKFAEYFATVLDKKIVGLCDSCPAHELLPHQIMLTREEYLILQVARGDLNKIQAILDSIKEKVNGVKNVEG